MPKFSCFPVVANNAPMYTIYEISPSYTVGGYIVEQVPGQGPVVRGYTSPYALAAACVNSLNYGEAVRAWLQMEQIRLQQQQVQANGTQPPQQIPQVGAQPTYGPALSALDAHQLADQMLQAAKDNPQEFLEGLRLFNQEHNIQNPE
jgi:hypothetical protein